MLHKLCSFTRGVAYWTGARGARERNHPGARVLVYHGTPLRQAGQLARQLRYLKRYFRVVPLGEIVAQLGGSGAGLTRSVALTFDDGLRNNVTVAYPLLRRYGIPASFFVCPELIERQQWLWTHEARQRLRHCARGLRRELVARHGVSEAVEDIVAWMKKLPQAARVEFESSLRQATRAYQPSPAEHEAYDLAGWEELRSLDPALVTIGSHTLSHPILPCVDAEQCELELRESRRRIEERLQRPARLLTYPNGDYSPQVREAAGRHYRAALADWTGAIYPSSDPLALPRIYAPRGVLRIATAMHTGLAATPPPSAVRLKPLAA